jgi:predicted ribosome-associated RNA-binding protein Tma20
VRSLVSQGKLYKNKIDLKKIVRTVPLPSNSQRIGPILLHPSNLEIEAILSVVGKPIVCETEDEMIPLVSLTGHISPFFELMRVTQDWAVKNGYVSSVFDIFD